jgi:two-component system alkaline phosphatase synthesis response regulator PhoP
MTHILLVDDEISHITILREYLDHERFSTAVATTGPEAVAMTRTISPDLIVLDIMLPGFDGLEVCRQVRQFSDAYILMLTARAEEIDSLVGLGVGADDYVTKPFSPREVVARIKAMLRRPRGLASPERPFWHFGPLTIDQDRHEVMINGQIIGLTAREFALLVALASVPDRVLTRTQLLERVWGDTFYDMHVVDVHVANVRKKLEGEGASPPWIETVRGVGYRFRSEEDRS